MLQKCRVCEKELTIENTSKSSLQRVRCKKCFNSYSKKSYNKNKDVWKEHNKKYVTNNRAKILARQQSWYKKNFKKIILRIAQKRALEKGIPFSLTEEDFIVPEFCPVLGIKLECCSENRKNNSITLDRIIPSLGYTKENVRVISWRANMLKKDGTLEEFRKIVSFYRKYKDVF